MRSPDEKIRILIIDDHALFREGLARLLEAEPDLDVVGQCASVEEALRALREQPADIVLLDFDLGLQRGSEFLTCAQRHGFQGRVLVVTAGLSNEDAASLLGLGIAGIFLKHNPPTLLAKSVRKVMDGEAWIDSQYLGVILKAGAGEAVKDRPAAFSERQRAVVRGVLNGLANKQIAEQLAVSETSVKASLQQLFLKTGVRTRSQLVRVVLEQYADVL